MSKVTDRLRVVLAEDNYLVREGTRRLLEDSGRIEVVAAVGTAEELVDAVGRLSPHAVVTDIRMPPTHQMEGVEAARAIRRRTPNVGVVVLSQYVAGSYALELFRDGTSGLGYLLKERVGDLDELLHAIEAVAQGRSIIDPKVVEALVSAKAKTAESPLRTLTPRELEVLREMAQGKNNAAIGKGLVLSESAVEKHISSIFQKLGVTEEPNLHGRVSAVLTFLRSAGTNDE